MSMDVRVTATSGVSGVRRTGSASGTVGTDVLAGVSFFFKTLLRSSLPVERKIAVERRKLVERREKTKISKSESNIFIN